MLTKIDVWVKRKRSQQQILLLRGDRESIFKTNLIILHYLVHTFLTSNSESILSLDTAQSIFSVVEYLHLELKGTPISKILGYLWNTISLQNLSHDDQLKLKGLLEVSVLFQVKKNKKLFPLF